MQIKLLDGKGRELTPENVLIPTKQIPYVTMLALNNTAFDVMKYLKAEVLSTLDIRKTGANAFRIKKATKSKPTVSVFIDDYRWQAEALHPHYYSGDRERKGLEKSLIHFGYMSADEILTPPPNVTIRKGMYNKIMSQLKLGYKAGYNVNESAKSKKRKIGSRVGRLNIFIIGSRTKSHLHAGIYVRDSRTVIHNILRISKKPNYTKVMDLDETASKAVSKTFGKHYRDATKKAMATAN